METTDDKDRRGSSKNLRVHFEIPPKEVDPDTRRQTSSSSSSSASSLDFDAIDKLLSNPPVEPKHTGLESPETISSPDLSAPSPWSSQNGSAAQSPPVQLMGQPAGYDPNRIPVSIFSAKPAASPMEWSVASNESLFSIHIGNNSFSRDHFIMFNKSGELLRPDELTSIPATLPCVNEAEHEESKSADVGKENSGVTEASDETKKIFLSETPGDDNKERISSAKIQNYNTNSYLSDESNNSGHSFHFPVLAGDGGIYSPATVNLETQSPQQQSEQQTQPLNPEKTTKRAGTNWFCCFSCYPQCC